MRTTATERTTVTMKATATVWQWCIPCTKSNKSAHTIHRDIGLQQLPSCFDEGNCLPAGVGFASFYFGTEHLSRPSENYAVTTHTAYTRINYGNTCT